ncbi:Protein chain release factor B-like protein [Desulfatibacillum aliphaticivorans]|uniref:Protein chain release factor B-like protein n=1 Tax=Desulfatibacillum aliphaticivorans TaxID=218208 RepID=B8FHF8_DESAL|nr:protein chain release factor B-like protein [Desulfatibacillum aliphaticivorans]ACL02246.1 Protein chain release factor B-like protein [Desulfatibacillum aliphaticivorans]
MKKYATITSGRGPAECQWAAARVRDRFVKEAEERKIPVKIRESIPGDNPGDIRSCLLILDREKARDFLKSWEGTILWIGQSPYRPYHKRKNWSGAIRSAPLKAGSLGSGNSSHLLTLSFLHFGGRANFQQRLRILWKRF